MARTRRPINTGSGWAHISDSPRSIQSFKTKIAKTNRANRMAEVYGRRSGGGGGGGCFSPETLIPTIDQGGVRFLEIAEIASKVGLGEEVYVTTWNRSAKELTAFRVLKVWNEQVPLQTISIKVQSVNPAIQEETLVRVTASHPLLNAETRTFVRVQDTCIGDMLEAFTFLPDRGIVRAPAVVTKKGGPDPLASQVFSLLINGPHPSYLALTSIEQDNPAPKPARVALVSSGFVHVPWFTQIAELAGRLGWNGARPPFAVKLAYTRKTPDNG